MQLLANGVQPVYRMVAYAGAYSIAYLLGRATRLEGSQVALLWPAAFVGVLWVLGSRSRRELVASATLQVLTHLLMGRLTDTPWNLALPFAVVNLVLSLATVAALRPRGRELRLRDPDDLLHLLVGVLVGGAVAGVLAAGTFHVVAGAAFWESLLLFTFRNSLTIFVGLALLLSVQEWSVRSRGGRWPRGEVAVAAVVGVLAYVGVFYVNSGVSLAFLVFPVSVWIAVRFSTPWAVMYTVAAGAFVVFETFNGHGVFSEGPPAMRALLAQTFVGVMLLLVMSLALFRDSRERLIDALDEASQSSAEQAGLLAAVLDGISDGVTVLRPDRSVLLTNARAGGSYLLADVVAALAPDRTATKADPDVFQTPSEVVVPGPDGPRVVSYSTRPLLLSDLSEHTVVAFRDVTEQRRAQERVQRARDLFAGVLDAASEQSIIGTDQDGRITVFNVGAERMLGYSRQEMLGRSPLLFHLPRELELGAAELGVRPGLDVLVQAAREGRPETRQWTYVRRDRSQLEVMVSVSAMRGPGGEIQGYIAVASDITARLAAERASAESEERFRLAFDTAPVGMYLFGVGPVGRGRLSRVNHSLATLLGKSEHELVGSLTSSLAAAGNADSLQELVDQPTVRAGERRTGELAFQHADGSVVWGSVSSTLVVPESGREPYGICLIEDVTARKRIEAELRHVALHDSLTGAPNRVLMIDRLAQALAAAGRSHTRVGVLYLDLDGFKQVNDMWGHAEGDELLKAVADRLVLALRPGDTLARIGGDEFVVVFPDIRGPSDMAALADRLRDMLAEPYELVTGNVHDRVSASIGVVISGPGATAEGLLRSADQAMYAAKRSGKDRVEFVDEDSEAQAARVERMVPQLRTALDRGEFILHGQPIFDLDTGEVQAVETLVRWDHPTRGVLPPAEFLDVVEAIPDLVGMDRRVLRESCRLAAGWGEVETRVHVNVSARQLEGGYLGAEVAHALDLFGIEAERLVLEITETHTGILASSVKGDLARLRDDGVLIAIDDIGTGYSSLARLTELPVDILKIDKQFVKGIGTDDRCEAVVRGVIGIGAALDLEVVAEGIEEGAQLTALRDWGCRLGQGFYLGRPAGEAQVVRALGKARPRSVGFPAQAAPGGRDGLTQRRRPQSGEQASGAERGPVDSATWQG
jgi:diguanylate cyclase (GGDEF)-like protein/PAS domain S-box-containing protein